MSRNHEWLELIEVSGPFLALPVLREAFPQGLEELDAPRAKRLRSAYEEWRDAVDSEDSDLGRLHAAWVEEVLRTALEVDDELLRRGDLVPSSARVDLPEHDTAIVPDLTLVDPARSDSLLVPVQVFSPDTDLVASMRFGGLSCSPADRMAMYLRAVGCPLGVVTNGERWMVVHAPVGQVSTFASWYARLWGQEPETLRAFVSLLGVRRLFGFELDCLPSLFERSLKHQDEVTDALGEQVRRAVEVLVQALDRADQDRNRELLRDVKPQELYEAGLTVMMRLVFLLAAEERGLLLLGEPRYDSFYAVSTLRMQLRVENEEILERRRSAWSRLLAVFRAVFGGIDHPTLHLPAMGGTLFDPDRFPFLEGRLKGSSWRHHPAAPLPIDDRTVLLLLDAIQTFEGRTLSYRALDVEQIGHVYEGLLERTVKRVDDVTLELEGGAQAKDPRVTLGELESARLDGDDAVVSLFMERTRRSESSIRNSLTREVEGRLDARLLTACRGDVALRDRLEPYAWLLRTDPWGYPLVHPEGAFVVVMGIDRRETGTHYTPNSLTEKIVEETLTPLVYDGPAKGAPRESWTLKSPAELLDMKVCDPAMGSGAFLVQACRFLGARLVEAWGIAETAGKTIDIEGRVHDAGADVEPIPATVEARSEQARRLVAERCLYGVDLNPLAVELAKLSLWLVTLAKGRPFGFLDHNLRHGDSLLGISRLEQLTELSMEPQAERQRRLFGRAIETALKEAVELRLCLRDVLIRDIRDVEAMAALDAQVEAKLQTPERLADAFIGIVLASDDARTARSRLDALAVAADRVVGGDTETLAAIGREASDALAEDTLDGRPRRPFHWPLEFPEVFVRDDPGFDAFVGNPPFLGGQRITGVAGTAYRNWLVAYIAEGRRGSADLVAYFFLRAWSLLREGGGFGLLAVNTIAEGDTRQVGLAAILQAGAVIHAAYPNEPWPGKAAVATSRVHVRKADWRGPLTISGRSASFISADLSEQRDEWSPRQLAANFGIAFQGSVVLGLGFVLTPDEAKRMLDADSKNAEVVFPYLNGEDLNSQPDQQPRRWVINFWDWSEERARLYRLPWQRVEERVKPDRTKNRRRERRERWWQFGEKTPALYHTIGHGHQFERHPRDWNPSANLQRVLTCSLVSKYLGFAAVDARWVYAHRLAVFATDSMAVFALLASSINDAWARKNSSSLETRLNYSPSDAFETLPLCDISSSTLKALGASYELQRRKLCGSLGLGLTDLYNRFHAAADQAPELVALRELHREVDLAVARAYGWSDLDLGHDFHSLSFLPESDRVRFTLSESARLEVLRRLNKLNRERYEKEQVASPAAKPRASNGRAKATPAGQGALALVDAPEAQPKTSRTKIAAPAKKASNRRTSR